jgi:hypothetical protein
MKYTVTISPRADLDMNSLEFHIRNNLHAPHTASDYMEGLRATGQKLAFLADSIGFNPYIQSLFGKNARHIVYKKMAIIYVIRGNVVYVKRVIASSMIH